MTEIQKSNIDQEQNKIRALVSKKDISESFKNQVREADFQDKVFKDVDNVQKLLFNLSINLHNSEVQHYVEEELDQVGNILRAIAEKGYDLTQKTDEEKQQTFGDFIHNLDRQLAFINSDFKKYEELKAAEQILQKSEDIPSQPNEEQIPALEKTMAILTKAKNIHFSYQFSAKFIAHYYDTLAFKIDKRIEEIKVALASLKLQKNPQEYLQDIIAEAKKELGNRIKDPLLLASACKELEEKIPGWLTSLNQSSQSQTNTGLFTELGLETVNKDRKTGDLKNYAALHRQLENKIQAELDAFPFDTITVEAHGKKFECHFDTQREAGELQIRREQVNSVVDNYFRFFRNNFYEDFEEDIDFRNGEMKIKFTYNGNDTWLKNPKAYTWVRITPDLIEEVSRSEDLDQAQKDFDNFSAAFAVFKADKTPETKLTFNQPPKTVDFGPYLTAHQLKKVDLTLDIVCNDPPAEVEYLFNTKGPNAINKYKFDQANGKKYLKTETMDTYGVGSTKPRSSYVCEHDTNGNRIRSSIQYKVESHYEVSKTDYYSPPQNIHTDRNWSKTEEITSDGELIQKTEYFEPNWNHPEQLKKEELHRTDNQIIFSRYNQKGEVVYREIEAIGCPGIKAIIESDGKPFLNAKGEKLANYTRRMEFIDNNGKKIIVRSYPDTVKENPKLTEYEYLNFLAKMLTTDELFQAYITLMFEYTYDTPDPFDIYKKGSEATALNHEQMTTETLNRIENGVQLGDCEDWAYLLRYISQLQGKTAYAIFIPGNKIYESGHVETVLLEKDKNNKYHAVSYGTYGVDRDGNRIGKKYDDKKARGYDTPEAALLSLTDKWTQGGLKSPIDELGRIAVRSVVWNDRKQPMRAAIIKNFIPVEKLKVNSGS